MSDIYVDPVNGNDGNTGKTRALAVKTLVKGASKLAADDRLVAMAGTHPPQAKGGLGVSLRSDVTVYFEPGAIFDQDFQYPYHFLNGNGGSDNVVFDGLVLRKSGAAITWNGQNIEIKNCDIRETNSHCISINYPNDNIWIHHNYMENAQQSANYRSCISVFGSKNKGIAGMNTGDTAPNWSGTWGVVVTDNAIVNTGYVGSSNGDGNGIIIDCQYDITGIQAFHDPTASGEKFTNYDKRTLVSRNIVVGSAGCGIKVMMSRHNHVHRNTSHANKRNTWTRGTGDKLTDNWVGEFACYHIGKCFFTENIGYSVNESGGVFVMAKGGDLEGKDKSFTDDNVYNRNLLWNDVAASRNRNNGSPGGIFYTSGKNPTPSAPTKAASSPGQDGYFVAQPQFEEPLLQSNGKAVSAGALLGVAAVNEFRRRYALKAGSPGITAAADGGPLGAVRGSTPSTDIVVVTPPKLTIAVAESGKPFSLVPAVFNKTPDTTSLQCALFYDNRWNSVTVTLSGTNPVTGTLPSVDSKMKFSVNQLYTGTGVSDGKTRSDEILISPASATPNTPPECTVPPALSGAAVVGQALSGSEGTWTGNPVPTRTRQWTLDNVDVPGATGSSYTPVAGDVGKVARLKVKGVNSEAPAGVWATSAPSAAIIASPPTDDLAGLTRRVGSLEATQETVVTNVAANAARAEEINGRIDTISAELVARIEALEVTDSGIPERVDGLEAMMLEFQVGMADFGETLQAFSEQIGDDDATIELLLVRMTTSETSLVALTTHVNDLVAVGRLRARNGGIIVPE